jgi:sporulation protein YqfC
VDNKYISIKKGIAEKLDLPKAIVLNLPKISIIGNNEITIENHKGIILFEKEQVKINSGVGLISIQGSGFEILFMGGNTITISGKFKAVEYQGNE